MEIEDLSSNANPLRCADWLQCLYIWLSRKARTCIVSPMEIDLDKATVFFIFYAPNTTFMDREYNFIAST